MSVKLKLRLAFMGTPDIAVPALRALKNAGHEIVAVYCQPPKPAGRGQQMQKVPVQLAAEELGLHIRTPKTLRDAEEQQHLASLKLDVIVVVAYGLILPQAVLDAPRLGCINIHFSLLPRWRGAAPVQRAILAGDRETGIDIMQMGAGLDTGDVLLRETAPIAPTVTAGALLDDLARRSAPLLIRAMECLPNGTLKRHPQPAEGMTYAARLTREDGKIDWNKPAAEIERQIRALQPWPGCFFMLNGEPIKVLAAEIVADSPSPLGERKPPGALLDQQFTVACGQQALRLLTVQRAGKKPTDGESLLRGLRLKEGYQFS